MGQFLTKERQREIIKQSPQFEASAVIRGLVDAGHELEGLNASFSTFDTVKNIPSSTIEVGKNIFAALKSPLQTGKALSKIAFGGIVELANKIAGSKGSASNVVPGSEEAFKRVVNFYKQRFGSGTKILETIERDPAGFLSDVAGIIGGSISTVGKLSNVAGFTKTAQTINRMSKTVRAAEPIRLATKLTQTIARKSNIGLGVAHILGKSANRFTKSSLGLSKADIANFSGELGKKFGNPVEVLNRLGIHGSLEDIAGELGKRKRMSMANLDRILSSSTKTFETPLLKRAFKNINKTLSAFDSPEKRVLRKTTNRLIEKMKSGEGVTLKEINQTKRIAQEVLGEKVFKKGGDIKASKIADTLHSDMKRLKMFVENKVLNEGLPDVKKINKQTQFFRGMQDFVEREIIGIPSPSKGVLQVILATSAATGAAAGRAEIAIGSSLALVGVKVFTSTKFRTALGTKLRSLSDKQLRLVKSAHLKKNKVLTRPEVVVIKKLYGDLSKVFPEIRLIEVTKEKSKKQ